MVSRLSSSSYTLVIFGLDSRAKMREKFYIFWCVTFPWKAMTYSNNLCDLTLRNERNDDILFIIRSWIKVQNKQRIPDYIGYLKEIIDSEVLAYGISFD